MKTSSALYSVHSILVTSILPYHKKRTILVDRKRFYIHLVGTMLYTLLYQCRSLLLKQELKNAFVNQQQPFQLANTHINTYTYKHIRTHSHKHTKLYIHTCTSAMYINTHSQPKHKWIYRHINTNIIMKLFTRNSFKFQDNGG